LSAARRSASAIAAGARGSLRGVSVRLERIAVGRLERHYLGVDTGGDIRPQELGYPHGLYRGSSWLVLAEIFRRLEVGEQDVFVDVGSGMGRAVLMAARRPFKRVIGVERSERLNEVARGVVDRNRRRLSCQDVELVTVDALDWEIPDDLTVVYLYCPFRTRCSRGSSTGWSPRSSAPPVRCASSITSARSRTAKS
jgi:SAM-dependent methyltransferase